MVLMKATFFPLQFTPPASMYLVLVGDVLLGYLGDLNGVLVECPFCRRSCLLRHLPINSHVLHIKTH